MKKTLLICIVFLTGIATATAFTPNYRDQSTMRNEQMRSHKGDEAYTAQRDPNQPQTNENGIFICNTPDCDEDSATQAKSQGHTEAYRRQLHKK